MFNDQTLEKIKQLIQNNTNEWLSIQKCVNRSGLSDSTLRRSIAKGTLKANKVGGKWLVKSSWLEVFLNS